LEGEASPVAHTRHGDLTLDQIAETLPGMARLMVEISDRYWILYYAAQAGGWELTRHEFIELRKTMRLAALVRPKHREQLEQFEAEHLRPLEQAVQAQDWQAFDAAFRRATDRANESHRELGYAYIEWQLPATPPSHLRLDVPE
jgi:hypothetical protein